MPNPLLNYWEETLREDIAGFADPSTTPKVLTNGLELKVEWIQRGVSRNEVFSLSPSGDFNWIPDGDTSGRSYSSFLASPRMADLGQLAQSISTQLSYVDNYTPTDTKSGENQQLIASDQKLLDEVQNGLNAATGKTQLIFIKGEAGAGKTTLLEYVTLRQTELFEKGESAFLFLYVSAQGRALSNLRDAFAGETQDLRAAFTRDAVAPLTRRGLIVPIIDGFDELLGAAGYGDAFSSLQQFLAQLGGTGVIIVSARSSFYDIEFLGKGDPDAKDKAFYELEPITLERWNEEQIQAYVHKAVDLLDLPEKIEINSVFTSRDMELLGKPFFASRVSEYLWDRQNDPNLPSLLDFLVGSYIRRESAKIVDRDGNPLLDVEGHSLLFEEAAELMWTNESRQLNIDDLRLIAEFVAVERDISSDSAVQLTTKITSYAGFSTSISGGHRKFNFEHDVYFDYFLSNALKKRLQSKNLANGFSFFDRGILPDEVISAAVIPELADKCITDLSGAGDDSVLHANRRRNIGSILSHALRIVGNVKDISFNHIDFVNLSFGEANFIDCIFRYCRFDDVHLEQVKFKNCASQESVFQAVRVSDDTLVEITGLVPGQNFISLSHASGGGEVYSPIDIAQILSKLGAPVTVDVKAKPQYSPRALDMIALLNKLNHRFRRANVLCLQDEMSKNILGHHVWDGLHKLLIENSIVSQEVRPTSGKTKQFIRPQCRFEDLLRLKDERKLPKDNLGEFWRSLRQD